MTCPSGIKTLYINMIFYMHTATIDSVPAMWRDEIQAEIDSLNEAKEKAMNDQLAKLEEAHQKLQSETPNENAAKDDTSSEESE